MERESSKEYWWKAKILSYESCLQRTLPLFSSRRRAWPVLKHNRGSEGFKGFEVHDFEYYGQRNYFLTLKFNLCHKKCVIYF